MATEKFISRIFSGRPTDENVRVQHDYSGEVFASRMSIFNDTDRGVKIGRGMLSIISAIVLDSVGVARSVDGDIYIERRSTTMNRTYCMLLNKTEEKIYASIEEDDGNSSPFGEENWKYVLPLLIPFYFVEENPDWKPKLKKIIKDTHEKGMILRSEDFEEFWDAVYFWGKNMPLLNITMDRLSELEQFPSGYSNVNNEFAMGDYHFQHIVTINVDNASVEGPTGEIKCNLDRLNILRDMVYPITQDYREKMTDEQKSHVPDASQFDTYIVTKKFERMVKTVAQNMAKGRMRGQSVYLASEPGTGKSTAGAALAYVFGIPFHQTQFSANADESELIGTTIATEGKFNTSAKTEYMEVHKNGGVVVLDDINYAKTGVPILLNGALEAPFRIKGADNILYNRNPFSIIVTTVNPTAKGAHPINEAFRSRFGFKSNWPKLTNMQMAEMVMQQSGLNNPSIVMKMVETVEAINQYLRENQIGTPITPRDTVDWAVNTMADATPLKELSNPDYKIDEAYLNPVEAAEDTIICATNLADESDGDDEIDDVHSQIAAKFVAVRKRRNELGLSE